MSFLLPGICSDIHLIICEGSESRIEAGSLLFHKPVGPRVVCISEGGGMNDLGLEFEDTVAWFPIETHPTHLFIRVTEAQAKAWSTELALAMRRCYITDVVVNTQAANKTIPHISVIAAGLPDAGATMAGDFGEILVYFLQGASVLPKSAIGLKKWRLKQDRLKPAPYSDVVHLVLPSWPSPSSHDALLCSEVKTKSTDGNSEPIKSSIEDCEKDRTTRLAKTLLWLRDRAITGSAEGASIAQLNRFIEAAGLPATEKKFQAVSVVCESLVDGELAAIPAQASAEFTVVVVAVPDLRNTYMAVFDAAKLASPTLLPTPPAS